MIKASVKTYWKNMRFLIMILGILFIFLLVGLTLLANGAAESVSTIGKELGNYIAENSLSFEPIGQAFQGEGHFFEALGTVAGNYAGYALTFVTNLGIGVLKIAGDVVIFVILFLLGIVVCHDVVFVLARNKEKRGAIEAIFELFVRNVFVIFYFLLVGYFFYVPFLKVVGIVFLCAYPIAFCFLTLLAEWLVAGRERPQFTGVVTIKNIFLLFLENVIVLLISAVIGVLMYIFFGALIGFFLELALLILGNVSVALNGQAYVFDTYEIEPSRKKAETELKPDQDTAAVTVENPVTWPEANHAVETISEDVKTKSTEIITE